MQLVQELLEKQSIMLSKALRGVLGVTIRSKSQHMRRNDLIPEGLVVYRRLERALP